MGPEARSAGRGPDGEGGGDWTPGMGIWGRGGLWPSRGTEEEVGGCRGQVGEVERTVAES